MTRTNQKDLKNKG